MRFDVSAPLLEQLRAWCRDRPRDPTEQREDAFLLDPGLGPCAYLTADGRVLIDGAGWDTGPLREASDDEAIAAVAVGARKTGIADLLALLPPRPRDVLACTVCSGGGWDPRLGGTVICQRCHGLGWRQELASA